MVEQLSEDADHAEPEVLQSNMTMKMRTSAAYDVAGAKLEEALIYLRLLMGEAKWGKWRRRRSTGRRTGAASKALL